MKFKLNYDLIKFGLILLTALSWISSWTKGKKRDNIKLRNRKSYKPFNSTLFGAGIQHDHFITNLERKMDIQRPDFTFKYELGEIPRCHYTHPIIDTYASARDSNIQILKNLYKLFF